MGGWSQSWGGDFWGSGSSWEGGPWHKSGTPQGSWWSSFGEDDDWYKGDSSYNGDNWYKETHGRHKRKLQEQLTEEGKTYENYQYIGGDKSGSLRPAEKAKLISHQTGSRITKARTATWQSTTLDAVQFLLTKLSPRTRVHAVPTDPATLQAG